MLQILGLLKSLLKNRKPEDFAGILPPEGTTQFPGQEGLEGVGLRDIEAGSYKQHQFANDMFRYERPTDEFKDPKFDEERFNSTLMRNTPGRQQQGPSHIPFMPTDALRQGMQGIPPSMGPLQKLMALLQGSQPAQPPSHIPFVPTEGLTDPNHLNKGKY